MATEAHGDAYARKLQGLVAVVQELSLARNLETIMAIVRKAARELTGSDGATFVLRDQDKCYYADEYAIAPLWKGQRFPLQACISGWVMLNKTHCAIEDIYADDRIPADAYRPTFVKSLLMVPIRAMDPLGAIGNYWAAHHQPTSDEIRLVQALADTTAVAMENVQLYQDLERRVKERTLQLEQVNTRLQQEIVERKRAEEEVRRQAITDALTGLLNRRGFFQRATERLRAQASRKLECAIVFLDLDGLKMTNDSLGHDAGDKMIVAAASVIQGVFRGQVMARLGGDEFAVMLEETEGRLGHVVQDVQASIDDFIERHQPPFVLSLSVGVARFYANEVVSLDELIDRADEAMYRHKRGKRAPQRTEGVRIGGPLSA